MLLMLWVLKDTVVEGCFFHMWISLKSYWIMLRWKSKLYWNFALVNNRSCDSACLLLQPRHKLHVCTWDAVEINTVSCCVKSYKVQLCLADDINQLSLCLWQCARLSFHMCQRTIKQLEIETVQIDFLELFQSIGPICLLLLYFVVLLFLLHSLWT